MSKMDQLRTLREASHGRRAPPPVLNGSKALKAKPKRKKVKQVVGELPRAAIPVDDGWACAACKRPFPMTPAERQRKRRAKIAKLNKARK